MGNLDLSHFDCKQMFSMSQPIPNLALAAALLLLCSCFKEPVEKWPRPIEEVIASGSTQLPPLLTGSSPTAAPQPVTDLITRYAARPDQRPAMLEELLGNPSPENASALVAILTIEKELLPKLKIIRTLPRMNGDFTQTYKALTAVVLNPPSLYLQEAALDSLELLEDARTLPLWKALLVDENPKIRERAVRLIQLLQPATPAQP